VVGRGGVVLPCSSPIFLEDGYIMKSKIIALPFGAGRIVIGHEPEGAAKHIGGLQFGTNLRADLFHRGKHQGHRNLGSGLVTNIGVLALCGDMLWASPSAAAVNLFKLLKYHASGKGTTAAAIADYRIETDSTVGGETPVAGTQVFTHDQTGTVQKIVSVATIAYTGSEAVTEWGFFNDATLARTTGSPFTATTANTGTVTGTPLTASSSTVQGEQQHVINTTTTPRIALITSNTTSVVTLSNSAASGWMVSTTGVIGSTPGSTETYTLRPVMWDHKVFSAINVVNLDSIQFTYTLTISSGG